MFAGSRRTLLTKRHRRLSARDLVAKYSATSAIILDDFDITHTWGGNPLLYTDSSGTTPVTAGGDLVGKAISRDGTGNHVTQATTGSKPTWQPAAGFPAYLSCDGTDDRLTAGINPGSTGMYAVFARGSLATAVVIGAWFSTARCYMGFDANGRLSAGLGTLNYGNIFSTGKDRRNTDFFAAFFWDGSFGTLIEEDKVVYRAAQSGSVPAVAMCVGACGANSGTITLPWQGRVYNALYANINPSLADLRALRRAWLSGIS